MPTKKNNKEKRKIKFPISKTKEKIYSYACIFFILDQLIKYIIRINMKLFQEIVIIPKFFSIFYVENKGAAFSIMENKTFILILISFIYLFILDYFITKESTDNKLTNFSFGIIIGGIIGNLFDRLIYNSVTDYLSFTFFKYEFAIFNLADIGITVGIFLLILSLLIDDYKKKNKIKISHK